MPKILEIHEEQRLLNWTLQNRSFRDYVVLLTILRTGLNTNELRELQVSDIYTDREIVTHLEVTARSHKPQPVRLPKDLREQFKLFLEWKQQQGESIEPASFLFSSTKSPQITLRHLQRIVRESTIGAFGEPYRANDLRSSELEMRNAEFQTPKRGGVWQTYDATDGLPGGVECLLQDRLGYLWLGTSVEKDTGTGLCRYDGSEFITYTTDDGLADNCVMCIYEDHQGRLWLGTPEGISCFDGQQFTNYTKADGLGDNYVCAICEDRQGRLWIGTREGALSCYDGQRFTNYTTEIELPYVGVSAICEDHRGGLWFGTKGIKPGGVSRFDGQRPVFYTPADGLAGGDIHAIYEDRRGHLWFGTYDGVSVFDGEQFTSYTTADGLGNNHVWKIYEDRQGRLWFGFNYAGGGVSCLVDPDQSQSGEPCFTTYTTRDGLLDNEVYDIIQDREGNLWFAHAQRRLLL